METCYNQTEPSGGDFEHKLEEKEMDVINEQVPYFDFNGLSCSESTLRCLIERGVVDMPLEAVRLMSGMHGGALGRERGGFCGAITGGAAALGWVFGRTEPGQKCTRLYELENQFIEEFEAKYGSVKCGELLTEAEESRSQLTRCADQVVTAVEIVTRLIQEERAKQGAEA